jgi:hypothetical protein
MRLSRINLTIRSMTRILSLLLAMVLCSVVHIYRMTNVTRMRPMSTIHLDVAAGNTTFLNRSETKEYPVPSVVGSIETNSTAVSASKSPKVVDQQKIRQQAIQKYRRKVNTTNQNAQRCLAQRRSSLPQSIASINVTFALECLHRTTPNLNLQYPIDAEEHYNEIRRKMAPWAQHEQHEYHKGAGYSGPWIENEFIAYFETLFDRQSVEIDSTCLADLFGPFIPLFIPWVDHWVHAKSRYPKGFIDALRSVLRPDVPYITVSQNAQGLRGFPHSPFPMKFISNVLILSAGGYGHVPIPLLKQEEPRNNFIPVRDRTIDLSYVGSLMNAPFDARKLLHQRLMSLPNATTSNSTVWMPTSASSSISYHFYYGDDWRKVMSHSRYSLVPRGFGRTAYHLMETLQMGLVPVYVYLDKDMPWIPYKDLFPDIGYITTFNRAAQFVERIRKGSWKNLQRREERILSLRQSHFSINGTLNHIGRFMRGVDNDLRCQALPKTATGKR